MDGGRDEDEEGEGEAVVVVEEHWEAGGWFAWYGIRGVNDGFWQLRP